MAGCFAATACSTTTFAQKAYAEDCDMAVEAVWLQEFKVAAKTQGECGLNELELSIRNTADEIVWRASYAPGDLFGFWDVDTPEAMESALSDWITNVTVSSTATLPQWQPETDGPEHREFPFYPADEVDQYFYEMTRDLDLSMVCYVQGRESMLCLFQMPDEAVLKPIGAQSFPG